MKTKRLVIWEYPVDINAPFYSAARNKCKKDETAKQQRKKNKINEQNGCCFSFSCSSEVALISYEYVNTKNQQHKMNVN